MVVRYYVFVVWNLEYKCPTGYEGDCEVKNYESSFEQFDTKMCMYVHDFFVSFFLSVMAGSAPEGSQFDANQYDSKMNDLYVFKFQHMFF